MIINTLLYYTLLKNKNMREKFKNYLINDEINKSGKKLKDSTINDYLYRVERICREENITLEVLAKNIDSYVEIYGPVGNKSKFGKGSHNSYISSLKHFQIFLSQY